MICTYCKNPAGYNSFICDECKALQEPLMEYSPVEGNNAICTCDDEMCDTCKAFQQHGIRILEQQEGIDVG